MVEWEAKLSLPYNHGTRQNIWHYFFFLWMFHCFKYGMAMSLKRSYNHTHFPFLSKSWLGRTLNSSECVCVWEMGFRDTVTDIYVNTNAGCTWGCFLVHLWRRDSRLLKIAGNKKENPVQHATFMLRQSGSGLYSVSDRSYLQALHQTIQFKLNTDEDNTEARRL